MKFNSSKFEHSLIIKIVDRALKADPEYTRMDAMMDIEACHCNGHPLDLQKLLTAPRFDFIHDVFGIRRHIDRSTGKLMNCFSPRCSMPESVVSGWQSIDC